MIGSKRKSFLLLLLFLGITSATAPANAKITLPAIFTDGMVLQRDKPIRVWGKAEPGELIGVKIGGNAGVANADKKGRWSTVLQPLPLQKAPLDLVVRGKDEAVVHNVVVGDVWLCAGESNMKLPYKLVDATEKDTSDLNHSDIRLLKVNNDQNEFFPHVEKDMHWTAASKEEVEKFSGLGVMFGLDLNRETNVPIGLIQVSHGGSPIDTFVSRNGIDASNEFRSIGTNSDKAYAYYQDAMDQYRKNVEDWQSGGQKGEKPVEPHLPAMQQASVFFDTLIAPIAPSSLRGVLFYQGESDVNNSPLRYRGLFALMVKDWRAQMHDPTLPFIYVQLPNFGKKQKTPEDSDWALFREGQAICRRIPYTYMVVSIDTIPGAIADIVPIQKREIANRAATVALATLYKMSRPYANPIYDSMVIQDGKIKLKFRYADKGLISRSQPVIGFEIAGENKMFTKASAQIDGDSVIVSHPKVGAPLAVRYGWADNPVMNMYNADKLPVAPFRTDDWARLVQKKTM